MGASPIDRQMYARQYREITEEFPELTENAGCQTLQELSTLRGDEPYANFGLEDARQECYTAWFAYKDAKQAEWCASSPMFCSTEEIAATWALVGANIVQTMGHGLLATGSMLLDGKFNELGTAVGEGIASSVLNIASHAYDAAAAYYTPELSPEEVAAPLSVAALDAMNIFSVYKAAGFAVGVAEAAAPAAVSAAKSIGENTSRVLSNIAGSMTTPEGLSLSVAANGGMAFPGIPRLNVVPKQHFPAAKIPHPSTILHLRPEVLKQLLEATMKRLEGELARYPKQWDEAAQISDSMRPRLTAAERAMFDQARFLAENFPELGKLAEQCYQRMQEIEAAKALARTPHGTL